MKLVKPFILVVCKDISHAKEIHELINTDAFYDGQYKGKVLQIDSSTKKEEDIIYLLKIKNSLIQIPKKTLYYMMNILFFFLTLNMILDI